MLRGVVFFVVCLLFAGDRLESILKTTENSYIRARYYKIPGFK